MDDRKKRGVKGKRKKALKSAGNNQWVSTGLKSQPDKRERRDGPGGEDGGIQD
jgi:hypothetical protein